ncbi:DUF4160 domain-containing protein [Vibrio parahaemolyticus]|uniref:DUF4160 domain-containing protein n=1 Tax=Vibrio parahaemolyticus TaxID=670 RepID=UPI00226BB23B|nr:DUF4160 domain-containing protein [Vibrio parahaemolyticus]MCX8941245.1 DUF4160 domain-containing protein [Vibrio parahaemolyticus]
MNPKVYEENGFKFFFWSNEEERMHVHVTDNDGEAKFWLEPSIELADSYGFPPKTIKRLQRSVEKHKNEITASWEKHFGINR